MKVIHFFFLVCVGKETQFLRNFSSLYSFQFCWVSFNLSNCLSSWLNLESQTNGVINAKMIAILPKEIGAAAF